MTHVAILFTDFNVLFWKHYVMFFHIPYFTHAKMVQWFTKLIYFDHTVKNGVMGVLDLV